MQEAMPSTKKAPSALPASALIDEKIELLPDWRGRTLASVRRIIHEADRQIIEEWKWGTPVWSRGGIVCTGEVYKAAVKLTFPHGAALEDPTGLFNSSLEGNVRRALDLREGEKIDRAALKALIRAAIAHNLAKVQAQAKPATKKSTKPATTKKKPPSAPRAVSLRRRA